MKYYILFPINLLLFSPFIITEQNNQPIPPVQLVFTPQVTVPIHNHTNQPIHLDNNNIATNKNILTQTITTYSIIQHINDYVKSLDPKSYKQFIHQWFKQNKYKVMRYSIFSSYVGIWVLLFSSQYHLNKPDSWAQWQASTPFTELCTKPSQLLQQELIFDIQKRYINQQNPSDFLTPFVTFMNKITIEETTIHRYLLLLHNINRLYLRRLFVINEKKIKKAEQAKQRVAFVKQLFLSWAAAFNINEYNLNQGKLKQPAS